jgi:DNA-binding NtrC family response regulator
MTGRILVVDDDGDLRETLEQTLTEDGFQVTTRKSAEEALSLLGTDDFDVLVTDLKMDGRTASSCAGASSRTDRTCPSWSSRASAASRPPWARFARARTTSSRSLSRCRTSR